MDPRRKQLFRSSPLARVRFSGRYLGIVPRIRRRLPDARLASVGRAQPELTAESKGLANTWPANGPRRLWTRNLGDGYSAIAVKQGKLYTMHRRVAQETGKVDQDVVISMDANTGKTLWEYSYDAPFDPKMKMENGPGPHVTPLVAGNRLFTVGVMGVLLCLDKGMEKYSGRSIYRKNSTRRSADGATPAAHSHTGTRSLFRQAGRDNS